MTAVQSSSEAPPFSSPLLVPTASGNIAELNCTPDLCSMAENGDTDLTLAQEAQLDSLQVTAAGWEADLLEARNDANTLYSCFQQSELSYKRAASRQNPGTAASNPVFYLPDSQIKVTKTEFMMGIRQRVIDDLQGGAAKICEGRTIQEMLLEPTMPA